MEVKNFFDLETFTHSFVVYDEKTLDAIVIDPVLNFQEGAGTYSFESIEEIVTFVKDKNLNIHYYLDTHVHADHMSGSFILKEKLNVGKTAISENIVDVQKVFSDFFNLKDFPCTGEQFDILLADQQILTAGSLKVRVLATPGHTPACQSFVVNEEAVFTGDTLFMPDFGVARCDFPKGSADTLFNSITNVLYSLPSETKVFVGHDYMPSGRKLRYETTIADSKKSNIFINDNTKKEDFIKKRESRDKLLDAPKLLYPSLQVNLRGGRVPEPEDNGTSYLKIPFRKKS